MNLKHVTGVDALLAKLQTKSAEYENKMIGALVQCGFLLERYSKQRVPIQHGALRKSGSTRVEGAGWDTRVIVAYTADYAMYVHENTEAKHGEAFNSAYAGIIAAAGGSHEYWFLRGPGQTAKFLSGPMQEHHDEFVDIVRRALT